MKKFYLLQRVDTKQYFGSYRGDDYWTKDIDEAHKFDQNSNFILDEYTEDFFKEADTYFKSIEILKI